MVCLSCWGFIEVFVISSMCEKLFVWVVKLVKICFFLLVMVEFISWFLFIRVWVCFCIGRWGWVWRVYRWSVVR